MEEYLKNEPFPHILMKGDEVMYASARSTFLKRENPELDFGRRNNVPMKNNNTLWHYIEDVTNDAFELFYPYLMGNYPKWVFNKTRKRFLYCHNKANAEAFTARDWHLDVGDKLVTGLWYMPHTDDTSGGDLLLRNSKEGEVTRVSYEANTIILFPNLTTSWHKVDVRAPSEFDRNFVNIVMEMRETVPLHNYQRSPDGSDSTAEVVNNYV